MDCTYSSVPGSSVKQQCIASHDLHTWDDKSTYSANSGVEEFDTSESYDYELYGNKDCNYSNDNSENSGVGEYDSNNGNDEYHSESGNDYNNHADYYSGSDNHSVEGYNDYHRYDDYYSDEDDNKDNRSAYNAYDGSYDDYHQDGEDNESNIDHDIYPDRCDDSYDNHCDDNKNDVNSDNHADKCEHINEDKDNQSNQQPMMVSRLESNLGPYWDTVQHKWTKQKPGVS